VAVVSVNTDHTHLESTLQAASSEAANARDLEVLDAATEYL
jgi:hypothetical protein